VRNHFSYMATLNQMSNKKPAVLQRAVLRFKTAGKHSSAEAEAEAEGQDVPYKVVPEVEGRIRRIGD
jgi:hypothetical protein